MARKTLSLNEVITIAKMMEDGYEIKEIANKVDVSIPFMYNLMNMNSPLYELVEMMIEDIQKGYTEDDLKIKYRSVPLSSYKKMKQHLNRIRKNNSVDKYELIIGNKKVIITGKNVDIKIIDLK